MRQPPRIPPDPDLARSITGDELIEAGIWTSYQGPATPGGTPPPSPPFCFWCKRPRDLGAINDGHALDCEAKAKIDAPPENTLTLTRRTDADPTLRGCYACSKKVDCKYLHHEERGLAEFGDQYINYRGGPAPAGFSDAKKLLLSFALLAEGCDSFRPLVAITAGE